MGQAAPCGAAQSTGAEDCAPWRDHGPGGKIVQAVRARPRGAAGREPPPRAACIESPAVTPTEVGGPERGDAGGKPSTGRKRPLWGQTLGWGLASLMTRVGLDDGMAAPRLRGHVTPQDGPRLMPLWADQPSPHPALDAWRAAPRTGGRVEVQAPPAGLQGCTPREQRGGMERTNAWQGRYRRHRKDYARSVASRTALMHSSPMPLLLHRRAPCACPALHSRKQAAC